MPEKSSKVRNDSFQVHINLSRSYQWRRSWWWCRSKSVYCVGKRNRLCSEKTSNSCWRSMNRSQSKYSMLWKYSDRQWTVVSMVSFWILQQRVNWTGWSKQWRCHRRWCGWEIWCRVVWRSVETRRRHVEEQLGVNLFTLIVRVDQDVKM